MTGSPYGFPGSPTGPQGSGAPGWPPVGPPPGWPTQPAPQPYGQGAHPQQGVPYPPQQGPQPYGQHPYSTFAPQPAVQPQAAAPLPGSAPLGPPKPNSLSIDSFKPPKKQVGALIAFLLGFAVLIGTFIAVDHFSRGTPGQPVASDAPSASASSTLPGLEFVGTSAKGVWEITDTRWASDRVTVTIKLTVTSGTLRYTFYAYTNTNAKVSYPEVTSSTVLEPGRLTAGQSATGTLTLKLSHSDATLILADSTETPLSGLAIKA